jgi:hypothetical protein
MMPCRFSLDLPLFGLGSSSKGHGSNFWLSANRTALFHWTLDLRRLSKAALSVCGRHLTLGETSASREDGTIHGRFLKMKKITYNVPLLFSNES